MKMKIGEVAKRLGTTQRTLRFYEEQGLIKPERSVKGTRYYTSDDLERVTVILRMTEVGVPLAQIRKVASLFSDLPEDRAKYSHVEQSLSSLAEKMAEQQRALAALENELHMVREHLSDCVECGLQGDKREECDSCNKAEKLEQQPLMRLLRHPPAGLLQ